MRLGPGHPTKLVADVYPCEYPPGHRLVLHKAAEPIAEIVVSTARDRTATVYWIETAPEYRHRGLVGKLLDQALALLTEEGATHVVAAVGTTWRATGTTGTAPASSTRPASKWSTSCGSTTAGARPHRRRPHTAGDRGAQPCRFVSGVFVTGRAGQPEPVSADSDATGAHG